MVRSRILPTLADNIMMPDRVILVTNILVSYEIYLANLNMEQIHEATIKGSTSILFPCLIYRLCVESKVAILHYLDSLIEVQRTLVSNLIKAKDNQVIL